MEQKQPIVHSGRLFFFLFSFSLFHFEIERSKPPPLLVCPKLWHWRAQTVAADDRVELKFPCHFQIADVSKLNLARFSVLYYQVCLAFSQILMKSSMHETIPILCLPICLLNSVALSLCLQCLNFAAPFHGTTCACVCSLPKYSWIPMRLQNQQQQQHRVHKKYSQKSWTLLAAIIFFDFIFRFYGKFLAFFCFVVQFVFFLEWAWVWCTRMVSFTRFSFVDLTFSTSYITNLNPFYVCFFSLSISFVAGFTEVYLFLAL